MTAPPGPALVLIGLGLLVALLPLRRAVARGFVGGVLPGLVALGSVAALSVGDTLRVSFWDASYTLTLVDLREGPLSDLRLVFAWAFAIALLLWGVYAWRLRDLVERGAGIAYAGCAFGVVFAGDLLTLFLFWEGMAIASTVVILRGAGEEARAAAYRYVMVHILGGVLLLSGITLHQADGGGFGFAWSRAFEGAIPLDGTGPWLIFVGCAINAAAWPLAAWLPDAYPRASVTGTVLLGTFTTKTAVFALVVAFTGEEVLFLLGALMALYGFLYALGTRDYRRLLAYSLVGQVGFMLAAAGAGGELGANGAAAHAFSHVLYKSLLFMSAGAVLAATGRRIGGGHGGLWRQMPWTAACGLVGALAISAVPLTNGFVSKSLVLDAVHGSEHARATIVEWILLVVSAAAPLYVGLRFPYLAFSGRDEGVEARPAAPSMRLAMAATALLCLGLGIWWAPLRALLPLGAEAHVDTASHVGKQVLLLAVGTALFAAWWFARGRRPVEDDAPIPDTDALYLPLARGLEALVKGPLVRAFVWLSETAHRRVPRALGALAANPAGLMRLAYERVRMGLAGLAGRHDAIDRAQVRYQVQLGRYRRLPGGPWPIGRTVLYVALLLTVYLLILLLA